MIKGIIIREENSVCKSCMEGKVETRTIPKFYTYLYVNKKHITAVLRGKWTKNAYIGPNEKLA